MRPAAVSVLLEILNIAKVFRQIFMAGTAAAAIRAIILVIERFRVIRRALHLHAIFKRAHDWSVFFLTRGNAAVINLARFFRVHIVAAFVYVVLQDLPGGFFRRRFSAHRVLHRRDDPPGSICRAGYDIHIGAVRCNNRRRNLLDRRIADAQRFAVRKHLHIGNRCLPSNLFFAKGGGGHGAGG